MLHLAVNPDRYFFVYSLTNSKTFLPMRGIRPQKGTWVSKATSIITFRGLMVRAWTNTGCWGHRKGSLNSRSRSFYIHVSLAPYCSGLFRYLNSNFWPLPRAGINVIPPTFVFNNHFPLHLDKAPASGSGDGGIWQGPHTRQEQGTWKDKRTKDKRSQDLVISCSIWPNPDNKKRVTESAIISVSQTRFSSLQLTPINITGYKEVSII